MSKKKKRNPTKVTMKAWTNEAIRVTPRLFADGVLNTAIDECNPIHLSACTFKRHSRCAKDKACARQNPTCVWDRDKLVAKLTKGKRTKAQLWFDDPVIDNYLNDRYKQCRKVTITVTVQGST